MAKAVPFTHFGSNILTTEIEREIDAPAHAKVWLSKQYTDLKAWYTLPKSDILQLKPTKFADGRIRFLDSVEGSTAPSEFAGMVSGKYYVRTWKKDGPGGPMILSIEGESAVYFKLPGSSVVVSWNSPDRLPTFEKAWRPIVFAMDKANVVVRLTPEIVLFLALDPEQEGGHFQVQQIDYNLGFCCVNPCTEQVLAYGSYGLSSLNKQVVRLPSHPGTTSQWGFYVHFYPWGCLIIPQIVNIDSVMFWKKCMVAHNTQFGMLFHPPNMYIPLKFKLPMGTSRVLNYQVDFALAALKTSQTDIEIYLLMDGQLIQYNFSFDLRRLKPEKPNFFQRVYFKAIVSAAEKTKIREAKRNGEEYAPRWTFVATDDAYIPIGMGCPVKDLGHLATRDLAAIFDAERGIYYTHPPGTKLTGLFKVVVASQGSQADIKDPEPKIKQITNANLAPEPTPEPIPLLREQSIQSDMPADEPKNPTVAE